MLRTTTTTYIEVEYKDLERFITAHYGMPYSVITALEAHNGSYHSVSVSTGHDHYDPDAEEGSRFTPREGLDPEAAEDIREWRAGTPDVEPGVGTLLHDLACSGHVEPGEYLIKVSW
jgi:hypothetical protein